MARNRQVAINSNVDFIVGNNESFASYQLKRDADGSFVVTIHVSTLESDGYARLLSAATIDLSNRNPLPNTELLRQVHATVGEGIFHLVSSGLARANSKLQLSGFDEFRGSALSAHLHYFTNENLGLFRGNVLEQTAAKYVLALSFGAPTVQEFLASYDGVSVSAIKGRLHRAKREGLIEVSRDQKTTERGESHAG